MHFFHLNTKSSEISEARFVNQEITSLSCPNPSSFQSWFLEDRSWCWYVYRCIGRQRRWCVSRRDACVCRCIGGSVGRRDWCVCRCRSLGEGWCWRKGKGKSWCEGASRSWRSRRCSCGWNIRPGRCTRWRRCAGCGHKNTGKK